MGILKVAYMNVGRGCVAAHVFLESCGRKEVDICFVGECWVARDGNGTQSHPDYVMLVQEYGILPHSRTYYCLLFSLYHMFIVFVISY